MIDQYESVQNNKTKYSVKKFNQIKFELDVEGYPLEIVTRDQWSAGTHNDLLAFYLQ